MINFTYESAELLLNGGRGLGLLKLLISVVLGTMKRFLAGIET